MNYWGLKMTEYDDSAEFQEQWNKLLHMYDKCFGSRWDTTPLMEVTYGNKIDHDDCGKEHEQVEVQPKIKNKKDVEPPIQITYI